MTLQRVHVENFQSIKELDVELGRFTVIVGPSNSGKSAFLRALRMLVSNARGKAFIRSGAKQCAVQVATDEGLIVALGRGTKDHYLISTGEDSEPLTFTKLGGAVPEQVTQALRMQPVKGTSLNFAGQFDKPYLLDASGADVASTLGDLTKVTKLFDAAREANRRRLGTASELRTREADLQSMLAKVPQYAGLPDALAAVTEAERLAADAVQRSYRQEQLRAASNDWHRTGADYVEALRAVEAVPRAVDVPLADIEAKLARREQLAATLGMVQSLQTSLSRARGDAEVWAIKDGDAKRAYTEALHELGQCPTCGADAEHMHTELVEV